MMSLKGSRPLFNTKTWIRRRRAADRDTAQKIGCFIDPRIYIFYDNFYLNTIKPYIHPNRLSILFPARLCWVFFDIVEANYGVLSQNPGFVRRRPQVAPDIPPPMKRDRSQILPKKIEKNESFEQILRESMISRYWNWNMKMRRSVVLTSRE